MSEVIAFVQSVGVPAAIALFLVWNFCKREERMERAASAREIRLCARLDKVEDEHGAALRELASRSADALSENAAAFKTLTRVVTGLPCVAPRADCPRGDEGSP